MFLSVRNMNDHQIFFADGAGNDVSLNPLSSVILKSDKQHYKNVLLKIQKLIITEVPAWMADSFEHQEPTDFIA